MSTIMRKVYRETLAQARLELSALEMLHDLAESDASERAEFAGAVTFGDEWDGVDMRDVDEFYVSAYVPAV